jgi:molybdenum cofactor cytidylyltransferase
MIVAIVPAAGKSERMGRCKLTQRIDGLTVIERVVNGLREGGADQVVVVTGSAEVRQFAESAGAAVVWLATATASMRETVEHGLNWLEAQFVLGGDDAWLLMPGDYPNVTAEPVRALCERFREVPSGAMLAPVHEGARGHPILIPWRHVAGIRALPAQNGIDDYVRRAGVVEIPVASCAILHDVDTPEDLERAERPKRSEAGAR